MTNPNSDRTSSQDQIEFALRVTNSVIWAVDLDAEETNILQGDVESLFHVEREAVRTPQSFFERAVHPDDLLKIEQIYRAVSEGETEDFDVEFRTHPDRGDIAWIHSHARVQEEEREEDETDRRLLIGISTDITDRKHREQVIEELHQTTYAIWEADSPEAVAEIVVDAARDILDMSANAVHLYDEQADCLIPVATTDRLTDFVDEIPAFERDESLAWEVFETGDPQLYDDVSEAPGRLNPDTTIRSEMILPLADHGVFLVGSPQISAFDETDVSLIQTLAAHARSALDQLERERRLTALQERTRKLMYTPTNEATAQVAVEAAHDILDSPSSGVHLINEDNDELEPVAFVDTIRDDFDAPTYDRTAKDDPVSALVWEVFEREEPFEIDDIRDREQLAEATSVRSGIIHPLGEHGVFLVTAAQPNAFDETDKTFIEIIATSLKAGLDRVHRERNLQERERELERQNERLEEFASIVSHDLRNPLNVVQGRIDLAQAESESDHLETAATALDRCQALIDDVLTLAREGEAVSDVELVSLPGLIEDCWETIETPDATLQVETDQTIKADRSRLQQLLENLIGNAIEHGGEDVTVTVGALDNGFYVADDGPGIPEEDRETVFEAGYSSTTDGTGFGLNIVKEIATAHGWEITINESETNGARFEITSVSLGELDDRTGF